MCELENMVKRLAIMTDGSEITTGILPQTLLDSARSQTAMIPATLGEGRVDLNKLVTRIGRKVDKRGSQANRREQAGRSVGCSASSELPLPPSCGDAV
jgi:DNA-binding NtrC family response regulator